MRALATVDSSMRGFSMVELLVSMTLGLFLTAAVLQTFVSLKRTYEFQEEFSRIQENGRFAIEFLSRDVRMAGFFGCYSNSFDATQVEIILDDPTNTGWNLSDQVLGYDNVPNSFSTYANVVPGTDVIAIKSLEDSGVKLTEEYHGQGQMFVEDSFNDDCDGGGSNCHEGEILMVTDCENATIFQATNIQDTGGIDTNITHSQDNSYSPGNATPNFDNAFDPEDSYLARLSSFAYYIRNNTDSVPSLYRSRLTTSGGDTTSLTAEELVEGVEDMQILYGEDTRGNGVPDRFASAGTTGLDMDNVVSVRINLLLRSLRDNLAEADQSVGLTGGNAATVDRRIRKVFSTQIALRNRLD